jgi:hypothetical protein
MDAGYPGVLVLGAAFGALFAFFRRRMWEASSLGGRWLSVICLFTVANAVLSQSSVLAAQLGLTLAAVAIVFLLFRVVVRMSTGHHA